MFSTAETMTYRIVLVGFIRMAHHHIGGLVDAVRYSGQQGLQILVHPIFCYENFNITTNTKEMKDKNWWNQKLSPVIITKVLKDFLVFPSLPLSVFPSLFSICPLHFLFLSLAFSLSRSVPLSGDICASLDILCTPTYQ